MQFLQQGGEWLLVDGSDRSRIIATLRNEIEVVALAEFCKLTLSAPDRIPEHYSISHKRAAYTVTPLGSPGEKLSLIISGLEYASTVATEFTVPQERV